MHTTSCPCCSGQLLRHVRRNNIYWLCQSCRQEMPDFSSLVTSHHQHIRKLERLIDLVPAN